MIRVNNISKGEFKVEEVELPVLKDGEILLKIFQCGICGSDIQIYHGLHPFAAMPLVMGHECIAEVVDVKGINGDIKVGDKVTVQPQVFCKTCHACTSGHYNVCENMNFMGVHQDGFFAEYVAVPEWNVIKLADDTTLDAGMLVEPVAVAVNAAKRAGIESGSNVVVIGGGTIGNLVAQVCHNKGAKVMITDIMEDKLDFAKKCNIDFALNTGKEDLHEGILKAFNGERIDAIIDCAAVPPVFKQVLEIADRASNVVVVGNYKNPVEIDLSILQRRELNIIGVMQYVREDFSDAARLLGEGKIVTDSVITKHFELKNLKEAFEYIDSHPETMKIAIDICN